MNPISQPKNKTLASGLAVLGGSLGLHRFYLHGWRDPIGIMHGIATALGCWGIARIQTLGQDDPLAWVLVPALGLSVTASCLAGIVYALCDSAKWHQRWGPTCQAGHHDSTQSDGAAATNGLTVGVLVLGLLLGAGAFMATLAYGLEHWFMYIGA